MKKLGRDGFTLVEVLAVVVIISILTAIMIPSINLFVDKNKESNYDDLLNGIIAASKIYISDNRYDISLSGSCSTSSNADLSISKIDSVNISNSRLPINLFVLDNDLQMASDSKIYNPKNSKQFLSLTDSYIIIKYNCNTKNYIYDINNIYLEWQNL